MDIKKINDSSEASLSLFRDYNEAQLRHYYEPHGGIFIAESAKVIKRALTAGCRPESFLISEKRWESDEVRELIQYAEKCASNAASVRDMKTDSDTVTIHIASEEILSTITGYNLTQGVLCAMRRPDLPAPEDLLTAITEMKSDLIKGSEDSASGRENGTLSKDNGTTGLPSEKKKRIAILEAVVNPTNIGAIFRSAAAFNVDAVFLTHGCSDPLERRAIRVSMGNVFQIPWTYINSKGKELGTDDFELLRKHGYVTAALALKDDAISLDSPELRNHEKLALILGTEGEGLSDTAVNEADYKVIIPMAHEVDSLNVAAASAVTFWELAR